MRTNDLPTLLVSGVAPRRSDDHRETELTERLLNGLTSVASAGWNIKVSWGEEDDAKVALARLGRADALVVMGGPDVTPEFYGGAAAYPGATPHFPRSDEAQLALLTAAVERGVPTLGICRGMQLLNVSQGGTLFQDIADHPGHSNPALLVDFRFARHTVNICGDSHLGAALTERSFEDEGECEPLRTLIHSAHHQAADQVGESLAVVARADDGTVEAVEHHSAPAIGVQWHPEDPDAHPADLRKLLAHLARARVQARGVGVTA